MSITVGRSSEDLVILATDRSYGGKAKIAMRINGKTGQVTLPSTATADAAGSITTTFLAAGAVTKAKMKVFITANGSVSTGTGSSQSIAHGLGVVPSAVLIIPVIGCTSIVEGTHTSTNVVVTVTTAGTFKVVALA